MEEVQGYLDTALEVIVFAAERWPGVVSALLLYKRLITACLKTYNTAESFVVHSPSKHPTPTSPQDIMTPPSMSSPSSTTTASLSSHYNRAGNVATGDAASMGTLSRGQSSDPVILSHDSTVSALVSERFKPTQVPPITPSFGIEQVPATSDVAEAYTSQAYGDFYPDASIDPNTPFNAMPSVVPGLQGWDPHFSLTSTTASHLAYIDATVDPMNWSGMFGDQYSQYFNEPFPVSPSRERTLSQQEQIELMASLEHDIPDVSAQLVNESIAFYQS